MTDTRVSIIWDLRQSGLSLQAIGDKFDITRERVRQILEEHYETTRIERLFPRGKVVEFIGCDVQRLANLEKEGKVNPIRSGGKHLYNFEEIKKALDALTLFCKHCGKQIPIDSPNSVYCPDCSKERIRYNYPFLSEESKKKQNQRTTLWIKNHPERTRGIQRKASCKYYLRHRKKING